MKKILVTGGCGYIGSHFVSVLDPKDYEVYIVDNLMNSNSNVIENIKQINPIKITFIKRNIQDPKALKDLFSLNKFYAVIHFAGLKSVSDSIINPVKYYENNFLGSLNLIKVMLEFNVNKIIFSSSATVYGNINMQPVTEEGSINPINPYGQTKHMVESLLKSICNSNKNFRAICLRYFNPIGAHRSGKLGEVITNLSPNVMPSILNAIKNKTYFKIYGNSYATSDGTCIRDYIHVIDLVNAHLFTLNKINKLERFDVFNVGTGNPISVLQLLKKFSDLNKLNIKYKYANERLGDVAVSYANVSKINNIIGWRSQLDINDMCIDSWNWFKPNLK